ncbi:MAG: hypothetical protein RL751_1130 [Bacteroidota bacterium]|jgi:hypothetical protein
MKGCLYEVALIFFLSLRHEILFVFFVAHLAF